MRLSPASVLLTVVSFGCTQIPKVEPYVPTSGAKTCSAISDAATNRATEEFLAGTLIAVAGIVGVGAGMAMGPDDSPNAAWHERSRYLMVMVPSAVIGVLGVGMMLHSQQTDTLAYQTRVTLARSGKEADRFLYYQCVSERGDWSGDHTEAMRIQIELLKENMAAAQAAEEAAAGATTQASSAATVAADARTSAAKAAQIAAASAEATKDLAMVTEKLLEGAPPKTAAVPPQTAPVPPPAPALPVAKANLASKADAGAPGPEGRRPSLLNSQR